MKMKKKALAAAAAASTMAAGNADRRFERWKERVEASRDSILLVVYVLVSYRTKSVNNEKVVRVTFRRSSFPAGSAVAFVVNSEIGIPGMLGTGSRTGSMLRVHITHCIVG